MPRLHEEGIPADCCRYETSVHGRRGLGGIGLARGYSGDTAAAASDW